MKIKILKKIFLVLVILLLSLIFAFKNSLALEKSVDINLKNSIKKPYIQAKIFSDKDIYNIDDEIKIKVVIIGVNKEIKGEFKILELDKFHLISKKASKSKFSSDSVGNLFESITINIVFKVTYSGEYEIGPVLFNGKVVSSKKKIVVKGEKLFIGDNIDFDLLVDDAKDFKIEFQGAKQEKNIEDKFEKIDISDMKDIYIIFDKTYPKIFSSNSFIIILFLLIIYFFFTKLILRENKKDFKIINKNTEKINLEKLLYDLEKQKKSLEKQVFYKKLGEIFRIFLDRKYKKNFSSKSLSYLKTKLDKDLYLIYKEIYYPEYSPFGDKISDRERLLEKLKKIITP